MSRGSAPLAIAAAASAAAVLVLATRKNENAEDPREKKTVWADPYGGGWEHSQYFWCGHRAAALAERGTLTPYQALQVELCRRYIDAYNESRGRPPLWWALPAWLKEWN